MPAEPSSGVTAPINLLLCQRHMPYGAWLTRYNLWYTAYRVRKRKWEKNNFPL